MSNDAFQAIESAFQQGGSAAALGVLADALRKDQNYHELFDVLLMQSRLALGRGATDTTPLELLPKEIRAPLEQASLQACREVGALFLKAGRLREAWMYLRPAGEKQLLAQQLEATEVNEDNASELIDLALYEGIAPELGFRWLLAQHGVCNAITTFEGAFAARPAANQIAPAEMLLRRLHADLLESVQADITKREGKLPHEATLAQLVRQREWLFQGIGAHVDTTHLAAIIRFAKVLEDRTVVELALDLTEYGRRLAQQFQYPGDEPFEDTYAAHALFFAAQLGRDVEKAVGYFRQRAETGEAASVDAYVLLIARLGRFREAVDFAVSRLPREQQGPTAAPSLLELSRSAKDYRALLDVCRRQNDLVGFTAGLVDRAQQEQK